MQHTCKEEKTTNDNFEKNNFYAIKVLSMAAIVL
jgi:hypothetical protein